MANDNRRARRARHDSVIELFGPDGRLKGTGRLADFSETGVSFSSEEAFSRGEKFSARLRLLHKGVLDVRGEVVWTRGEGKRRLYGVKFDTVNKVYPTGEKPAWE
jgi:hypothetical protein